MPTLLRISSCRVLGTFVGQLSKIKKKTIAIRKFDHIGITTPMEITMENSLKNGRGSVGQNSTFVHDS